MASKKDIADSKILQILATATKKFIAQNKVSLESVGSLKRFEMFQKAAEESRDLLAPLPCTTCAGLGVVPSEGFVSRPPGLEVFDSDLSDEEARVERDSLKRLAYKEIHQLGGYPGAKRRRLD